MKLFYGLTSISPLGQGDAHERIIKAIYKAAGWDLADERFLQLQGLVAAFPLSLADGLADDMARLKRLKTKGPETEAVGRLVLDPFSATIYSSDPDTYAAIQDCERRGHSLADAIRIVAGGGQ